MQYKKSSIKLSDLQTRKFFRYFGNFYCNLTSSNVVIEVSPAVKFICCTLQEKLGNGLNLQQEVTIVIIYKYITN
jgi:hypothetical protein